MQAKIHRARNLTVSLTVLLVGASFYAQNVRAGQCGQQADFLARGDLLAPVRPADCARLLEASPDFAWPAARGREAYVVTVTHPDGRSESVATGMNALAWQAPLPAGDYAWTVSAVGANADTSAPRRFTVDSAASRR
jgi:hypothetical protein